MRSDSQGPPDSPSPPAVIWSIATEGSARAAGGPDPTPVLPNLGVVYGSRVQGHTRIVAMARPSPGRSGTAHPPTHAELAAATRAIDVALDAASALVSASSRRLEPIKAAIVRAVLHRWIDRPEHENAAPGTGTDLMVAVAGRGGVIIAGFGFWSAAVVTSAGVEWLREWTWLEDDLDDALDQPWGLDDPQAAAFAEVMWVDPGSHPTGLWLAPAPVLDGVAGPGADPDDLLLDVTATLRDRDPMVGADPPNPAVGPDGEASETVPVWDPWVGEELRQVGPVITAWAPRPGVAAHGPPSPDSRRRHHGDSTGRARRSRRRVGSAATTSGAVTSAPAVSAVAAREATAEPSAPPVMPEASRQPLVVLDHVVPLPSVLGHPPNTGGPASPTPTQAVDSSGAAATTTPPAAVARPAPVARPARSATTSPTRSAPGGSARSSRSRSGPSPKATSGAGGIRLAHVAVFALVLAILAVPAWALTRPSPQPTAPPTRLVLPTPTSTAPPSPSASLEPSPSESPSASESASPTPTQDTPTPLRAPVTPTPVASTAPAPTPTPTPIETTPIASPSPSQTSASATPTPSDPSTSTPADSPSP